MKNKFRNNIIFLLAFMIVTCLGGCGNADAPEASSSQVQSSASTEAQSSENQPQIEARDYASELQLNMNSDTMKQNSY